MIVSGKSITSTHSSTTPSSAAGLPSVPGKLECVPYARSTSGIQIYGDAHTWWAQAKGRYARGHVPRVGAVMAVRPHGNSTLGHVATVSRVVDSRTILLDHANWSYPGEIETGVIALDVSENNDWSKVRIWYGPAHALGASEWPVAGFIYNATPGSIPDVQQSTRLAQDSEPVRSAKKRSHHANDFIGSLIASAN